MALSFTQETKTSLTSSYKREKRKAQFIILSYVVMPLDFSLLLAPLLPGFPLPGSACRAASPGASRHRLQSSVTLCPTGQPGQVPQDITPHTSSSPAPPIPPYSGSWLWFLFTCTPSLPPTTTLLSQRSLSSPCIPPDSPLAGNAGPSHVPGDGPLLQHCPPAAPWNGEPSKSSAQAQPRPTDTWPQSTSSIGPAGPTRAETWSNPASGRGTHTLLQCSVLSKTQLILVHMSFLKV